MTDASKIRVLVVDDDPSWWHGFETRSKKSPKSFIELETSPTLREGLDRLDRAPDFDMAIVDLRLDNNQTAFDFIDQARQNGHFLPFAIASQEFKGSALADRHTMEQYVHSQATDFIEKRELKQLSSLQDRIRAVLNEFLSALQSLMQMYVADRVERDERLYLLSQEVLWNSKLIRSYSPKLKTKSFDRLCRHLDSVANECALVAQDSIEKALNSKQSDILTLKSGVKDLKFGQRSRGLALEDLVPFAANNTALRKIVRRLDALSKSRDPTDSALKELVTLLYDPRKRLAPEVLEHLVLELANNLARKQHLELGIELLYFLSSLYSRRGLAARVGLVDLMLANFLIENDRTRQAIPFLQSAKRYSSGFHALSPAVQAAIFFNRDRLRAIGLEHNPE